MFTLFLDLDGTLLDPKAGITESIQHALTEAGAEVPHSDDLEWCIGPPLHHSFITLLGEGADIEQAMADYREHYTQEAMYDAEPYDGLEEMFDTLLTADVRLFIATSKPTAYATQIADHFGLSNYVERLFGSELDGANSDKTDLLKFALDETGVDPAKAIMLGDRKFDIFGAKNNDILNIGALWGYGSAEELRDSEADMLAGAPQEVPEIAFDLLGIEA